MLMCQWLQLFLTAFLIVIELSYNIFEFLFENLYYTSFAA